MDYLSLIKEQDAEKTALVTETCQYTYGQLARRAQALRDAVGGERACRWIYADTIAEQLIQFWLTPARTGYRSSLRRQDMAGMIVRQSRRKRPVWA